MRLQDWVGVPDFGVFHAVPLAPGEADSWVHVLEGRAQLLVVEVLGDLGKGGVESRDLLSKQQCL